MHGIDNIDDTPDTRQTSQIANCVRLGDIPKDIQDVVKFIGIDGKPYILPLTYRYRTVTDFGSLLDETYKEHASPDADRNAIISSRLINQGRVQCNAQYLHAIIADWGLDIPLSLSACIQLADTYPGAARAVMSRYHQIITEGRLGN